jgi:hypothetical protein
MRGRNAAPELRTRIVNECRRNLAALLAETWSDDLEQELRVWLRAGAEPAAHAAAVRRLASALRSVLVLPAPSDAPWVTQVSLWLAEQRSTLEAMQASLPMPPRQRGERAQVVEAFDSLPGLQGFRDRDGFLGLGRMATERELAYVSIALFGVRTRVAVDAVDAVDKAIGEEARAMGRTRHERGTSWAAHEDLLTRMRVAAVERLRKRLDREPSDGEIAEQLGPQYVRATGSRAVESVADPRA